MPFKPGEGPSRGLLRDCKTFSNLREPSFEALVEMLSHLVVNVLCLGGGLRVSAASPFRWRINQTQGPPENNVVIFQNHTIFCSRCVSSMRVLKYTHFFLLKNF